MNKQCPLRRDIQEWMSSSSETLRLVAGVRSSSVGNSTNFDVDEVDDASTVADYSTGWN